MSKQQPCKTCLRMFMGPDDMHFAGNCPDCDAEIHGECHAEIERLEESNLKLIDTLTGIDSHLHDMYDGEPISENLRAVWNMASAAIKAATP